MRPSFVLPFRPSRLILFSALLLAAARVPAQSVATWGHTDASNLPPAGLVGVVRVAAGGDHSLALRANGTVAAWGANVYGQCNVPAGLTGVVAVAGGNQHSLALRADGTVAAWGGNGSGQSAVPAGLSGVAAVAAGFNHSLALRTNGTVAVWGSNVYGQRNVPPGLSGVTGVAAGAFFSLALKADGTVVGWGDDDYDQSTPPEGLGGVVQIAAGAYHAVALKSDGTVVAWGRNDEGARNVPAGLSGVVQVAAGNGYSVALKADGSVVAWGRNTGGERNVPAGLAPVARLAAGMGHTVALLSVGVELDRKELYSGEIALGTVSLAEAAGPGGASVALVSESPAVRVPDSVTVPEGATTATFPVATDLTFTDVPAARIAATRGGRTGPTALRVNRNVATLKSSHATVTGGSTVKPTLTLSLAWSPVADATLELAADPSLGLPATLTVPAGGTSVKVAFTHDRVTAETVRPIAAFFAGAKVAETSVKIAPIRGTVSFAEPVLIGGGSTVGYVFLTDPVREALVIPLTSGDPSVTVPATVRVSAGARQALFAVATASVPTTRSVRVTATPNGNPLSATLKVNALPAVASVTLPTSVSGRSIVTGTVRLKTVALPGGTAVLLSASDSGFGVPAQVVVLEGQYAATFTVFVTSDPPADTAVTVTATSGSSAASANVTVKRLAVSAFTLSTATVAGGTGLTGTVTLNAVVAFDTEVTVESADPDAAGVPATVTIPAGSKTLTFAISTRSVAAARYVRITVAKNGTSLYRTLKVTP